MNSRIIVNGTDLELSENLSMPFNYLVSDIREPEKKQANYSKTINIPATKANNLLFSNIYRIDKQINNASYVSNFAPDFNPNLKASAIVYINDIQIFSGNIQLIKINLKDKKPFDYEVILIGELSNIFYDMGERYLHSLDISEYSHIWNRTNITESWATRIQKNGANYVNFLSGLPIGEGYVYPLIDYGKNNGQSYKVTDLFPAIYAKTYIDKIFAAYGYTYTSTFFDSQLFKNLIVPFNKKGLALTQADINARTFYVLSPYPNNFEGNGLTKLFGPSLPNTELTNTILFTNDSSSPAHDENNLYVSDIFDPNFGRFIVHSSGEYNLFISLSSRFSILIGSPDTDNKINDAAGTLTERIEVYKYVYATSTYTSLIGQTFTFDCATLDFTTPANWFDNQFPVNDFTVTLSNVPLSPNDQIVIYRTLSCGAIFRNVVVQGYPLPDIITPHFYLFSSNYNPDSYFYNEPVGFSLAETDLIDMNVCIPLNIKQKDFFSSIIKMFNLYIDVDKANPTNLLIETRKDYYNNDIVDWTDRVDMTNMFEVIPMGDLNSKVYNFKATPDNDHYNERYKLLYNETYGDLRLDVNNDFIRGETDTQIIFSPTVAVGSTLHNRVIPCFVEYDVNNLVTTVTDLNVKKPKETNIRLLHYSMLKSTNQNFLITSVDTSAVTYSSYPFANHIDDVIAPTLDLNWSAPIELSYTALTYTNNNLFNKYWSGFISEITDANSKLISAMFYLKPTDILTLDFKKLYLIDGNYFRLNKILDYDPLSNNLTKVELIKTITASPFVGNAVPIIPTITSYNYIEGGQDEVRDIGATSFYNLIEGSLDEVRSIGATAPINFINGGLNNI